MKDRERERERKIELLFSFVFFFFRFVLYLNCSSHFVFKSGCLYVASAHCNSRKGTVVTSCGMIASTKPSVHVSPITTVSLT